MDEGNWKIGRLPGVDRINQDNNGEALTDVQNLLQLECVKTIEVGVRLSGSFQYDC